MKLLVWGIAMILALLWSAGIAVLASMSGWLAQTAGSALGGVSDLGTLKLPPWLEVWLDPVWRESVMAFVAWAQGAMAWITPWIGPALEWIAPLLWVLWAIGMVTLLVLAVGSQFLIGKLRPARAA